MHKRRRWGSIIISPIWIRLPKVPQVQRVVQQGLDLNFDYHLVGHSLLRWMRTSALGWTAPGGCPRCYSEISENNLSGRSSWPTPTLHAAHPDVQNSFMTGTEVLKYTWCKEEKF
jgi:hypothetical protein